MWCAGVSREGEQQSRAPAQGRDDFTRMQHEQVRHALHTSCMHRHSSAWHQCQSPHGQTAMCPAWAKCCVSTMAHDLTPCSKQASASRPLASLGAVHNSSAAEPEPACLHMQAQQSASAGRPPPSQPSASPKRPSSPAPARASCTTPTTGQKRARHSSQDSPPGWPLLQL